MLPTILKIPNVVKVTPAMVQGLGCYQCMKNNCRGCRLGAEAHGVTNNNAAGERAQAFSTWLNNTNVRTAGGQYLGTGDLVEFVQQVHQFNYDTVKKFLYPITTIGLIQAVYNAGSGTKSSIEQRMATDPQFKQDVQNITKKVLNSGSEILSTITGPIKGISMTITWLPWLIIGGLGLLAVFAFKNPDNFKAPRRISLT